MKVGRGIWILVGVLFLGVQVQSHALGFVSRCENPVSENELKRQVQEETSRLMQFAPDWLPKFIQEVDFFGRLTSVMNSTVVQGTLTSGYQKYLWVRYGRAEYRRRIARARVDLDFHWSTAQKVSADCQTETKIILPWIANYKKGLTPDKYRITFNLCEYVHDDVGVDGNPADMLIDPRTGCKTMADPEGYTLKELQARAVDLKRTLEEFNDFVNYSTLAVTVLAAWRLAPVRMQFAAVVVPVGIRVLNAAIFRTVLAAATLGGGLYITNENILGTAALRDLTEISEAISQAVNGRFVLNGRGQSMVPVSMPIEKFADVFERFLTTAREKAAFKAAAEVRAGQIPPRN